MAPKALPILVCLLALNGPAAGDAIVVSRAMNATTIMEIFVERSTVRVEIEMGLGDIPAFVNLLPAEIYDLMDRPPASAEERLLRFCTQDMIIAADGAPLIGRLVSAMPRPRAVRDEISGEPRAVAEEDVEPVVFFVLEYPLESAPETIAFKPPDNASPGAMATIGFVLYHLGVAANDFRYLTSGATVDLDWDDPWHSRFRIRQLRRTYDAPMNVFLYVEPYEVRVEVIIRPLDAQQWVDLGLEGLETIAPDTYGALQGGVADLLAERLALTIDGAPATPVLDRIHFLRRTLRASTVIDPPAPGYSETDAREQRRRFGRDVVRWLEHDGRRMAGKAGVAVFAASRLFGQLRDRLREHQGVSLHQAELTRLRPEEIAAHPAVRRAVGITNGTA